MNSKMIMLKGNFNKKEYNLFYLQPIYNISQSVLLTITIFSLPFSWVALNKVFMTDNKCYLFQVNLYT